MDSLEQLIRLAKHGDSEKFQLLFTKLQSVISPSQMTTLINSVSKKGQVSKRMKIRKGEKKTT